MAKKKVAKKKTTKRKVCKRHARKLGRPRRYEEVMESIGFSLTPTLIQALYSRADAMGIGVNELATRSLEKMLGVKS